MIRRVLVFSAALAVGAGMAGAAGELAFSAKVDKTTLEANTPLTLVLTLAGDLAGVELPKIDLPDGFAVGATSQSTNFSLQQGVAQRSTGLTYVVVPQREGVFQLGPFLVRRGKEEFRTEAIEVTVTRPAPTKKP